MVRPMIALVVTCVAAVTWWLPAVAAQDPFSAPAIRKSPSNDAKTKGDQKPEASAKPDKESGKPSDEKSDKPKNDEDEKKEGDEAGDSIKRPTKPPRVPDPREFDVRPGEDGLIRFNFYGQAWPDILQWFATISNCTLDWQELPQDYANVTTSRSYTVPETRDLFNRLLLDRGYTMLEHGRLLSVVRISKLDPSLLRRLEDESELMDLPPHEFVKITFKLPDKLKADKAAEDVKPLLSPNAKVQPLLATNRLLVIDAVINLREVSRLVNSEHAAAMGHEVPTEFKVLFARAAHVADQVMILLGLDPSTRRTPQELQVEQQRLQLFQQMQQKGKDVTKYLRKGESPTVFLAVNDRNNSILVNAPPAELRIIERAIQQLDVPSGSAAGAMSGALSMEKYQLVTISPQSIVTALEQIGDLDPRTRLRTDSDAKIVFAHATSGDHAKIQTMIDRLDGTGRELEVIWLRRLPADAVAATLMNLLVGKQEEDDSNNRRSFYYYPSRSSKKDKADTNFRVDADIERNRLLLWANEQELAEVRKFLEKLGEIPGRSGNPHTVRFLDPRDDQDMLRTLDQLRRAWKGPNELQIEKPEIEPEQATDKDASAVDARPLGTGMDGRTGDGAIYQLVTRIPRVLSANRRPTFVAATHEAAAITDDQEPLPDEQPPNDEPSEAAPIAITTTPDGRIVLSSDDTTALDHLEDLIASLTPPAPDFEVFHLKHASASMVTLNLEEYFEGEAEFDTDDNWWRAWHGFDFEKDTKDGTGLGQRPKIKFIYDFDTNTILVANASPSQLEVVRTLIELYDMAPSEDSISARSFQMFRLKYSRAEFVAKTVKEVFRDLLSSKDKDFDSRGEKKQEDSQSRGYYRIMGASDDDDKKPARVKASFQGALSVGIDEVSNSVIVSAQEEWMPIIAQMIEYLDENAKPETTVYVHTVDGQVNGEKLRAALREIVGEAWLGNRPPGAAKQNQRGQTPPQTAAGQDRPGGGDGQNPN